jgi:hypothetical protein
MQFIAHPLHGADGPLAGRALDLAAEDAFIAQPRGVRDSDAAALSFASNGAQLKCVGPVITSASLV